MAFLWCGMSGSPERIFGLFHIAFIAMDFYSIFTKGQKTMQYSRKPDLEFPEQDHEAIMMELQSRKCFDPADKYRGVIGLTY